jgi:hypothetical protein
VQLIFIHGPGAVGKLTVARELAKLTGFGLFHNHLVVDALLAVFEFGSPPFVRLREPMWLSVFAEAAKADRSLIFTFAPENTVSNGFAPAATQAVISAGGRVRFVQLTCSVEEQERRIENPSRAEFRKLNSLELARQLRAAGADAYPPLPAELVVDTGALSAEAAAARIKDALGV